MESEAASASLYQRSYTQRKRSFIEWSELWLRIARVLKYTKA